MSFWNMGCMLNMDVCRCKILVGFLQVSKKHEKKIEDKTIIGANTNF